MRNVVILVVIILSLLLVLLQVPTTGQSTEGGPKIVFLGQGLPTGGGPNQMWYLYCDRSRGNLLYTVFSLGGQWSVAVVPGGCDKN